MSSTSTNNVINFYLSEVDSRILEKQKELKEAFEKSANLRTHAETIQNFIGKYANFETRVNELQAEIAEMDRLIAEKQKEIDENRNFSRREERKVATRIRAEKIDTGIQSSQKEHPSDNYCLLYPHHDSMRI
ncbi:Protein CBG23039 [Caenorhabditis briggsae]|uniref:Protein CBG23039 n=1 Tax=Caenorhabditis briggsae TaxID=6238 RepID=A8Y3D8_CAEBR|nr:Protein CBG23039 [Caenorhabditis briggsae]CAP39407.1 Protein CBG23039 [Caenorhabditis briggsae]